MNFVTMNEQPYFHWDLLRQPIQQPNFGMGASFFDVNSILELRKEKSRDAARSRRGKENYEFYELAKLLPLPAAITSQLDKASIIRLSISYLKLRDFSGHGDPPWNRDQQHNKSVKGGPPRRRGHPSVSLDLFESHQGTHILQSLDGFAFILGNDGRFLYISETVSIYLGLSQVEMAGSSFFDYVHQQDHPELAEHLGLSLPQSSSSGVPSPGSSDDGSPTPGSSQRCVTPPGHDRAYVMNPNPKHGCDRSFCLRMKSTLTKRGVHVKSSGYRVVHVLGQLRPQMSLQGMGRKGGAPLLGLVGVAMALPPPTITELRLEHDTFITRMTPDFILTYCEPLISEHLNLSPEDVTNRSLYDMCHAGDLASLRQSHVDVLGKGQVMTDYYRMMNRGGGYVWVQTCATTLLNGKNPDDQNILAINYVLSGVEKGNCAMNLWQVCGTDHPLPTPTAAITTTTTTTTPLGQNMKPRYQTPEHKSSDDIEPDDGSQTREKGNGRQPILQDRQPSSSPLCAGRGRSNGDSLAGESDAMSDCDSTETGTATGEQSPGRTDGVVHDSKNSRRKMERPRKRKREELDSEDEVFPDSPSSAGQTLSAAAADVAITDAIRQGLRTSDNIRQGLTNADSSKTLRPPSRGAVTSASSPEDLSLKSATSAEVTGQKSQSSGSHPPSSLSSPVIQVSELDTPTSSHWHGSGAGGGPRGTPTRTSGVAMGYNTGVSEVTPSAVKELEAVMNRHLPFLETGHSPLHTDASLPVRSGGQGRSGASNSYPAHNKKSTIQWVGSHSSQAPPTDSMTASTFLRSLYESRESVIRSSGSCSSTTAANNNNNNNNGLCNSSVEVGGGHRGGHVYNDVTNMLTPPGDSYKMAMLGMEKAGGPPAFSIPSIVISTASSSSTPSSSLASPHSSLKCVPGYGSQLARGGYPLALNLALPCGGLSDSYGMTPPSSVSPQDKLTSPFASALVYNDSSSSHPSSHCGLGRPSLHHSSSSPSSSSSSSVSTSQSQSHMASKNCSGLTSGHAQDYNSAKAAYYAMSALGAGHHGHAGYADVNHNTTAAYDQCSRPVIPWY